MVQTTHSCRQHSPSMFNSSNNLKLFRKSLLMSFSQRKWFVNPEEKVTHHPNIDLLLLIYILAFYANSEGEKGHLCLVPL